MQQRIAQVRQGLKNGMINALPQGLIASCTQAVEAFENISVQIDKKKVQLTPRVSKLIESEFKKKFDKEVEDVRKELIKHDAEPDLSQEAKELIKKGKVRLSEIEKNQDIMEARGAKVVILDPISRQIFKDQQDKLATTTQT